MSIVSAVLLLALIFHTVLTAIQVLFAVANKAGGVSYLRIISLAFLATGFVLSVLGVKGLY